MGPASVAIVDRTALWRTTRLVSGDLGSNDPFIALADMATILGAEPCAETGTDDSRFSTSETGSTPLGAQKCKCDLGSDVTASPLWCPQHTCRWA